LLFTKVSASDYPKVSASDYPVAGEDQYRKIRESIVEFNKKNREFIY